MNTIKDGSSGFFRRAGRALDGFASIVSVANSIERGRAPRRADLERIGIDADQFYRIARR
jgi:hypothetical protein